MFNEELSARRCVLAVQQAIEKLPAQCSLIVVDDGSTDGTLAILSEIVPRGGVEIVANETNQGYGAALRAGALHARSLGCSWLVFMDSDLTNPPEHIARFLDRMGPGYDYIKASRYMQGGGVDGVPFSRRLVSMIANRVAKFVSGSASTDMTNGFRALRTEVFLDMTLHERGFPIIMEELFYLQRDERRGVDIPSTLHGRRGDQRPSVFSYRLSTILRYGSYPLRSRAALIRQRLGKAS